jgi:pyridoxamine 5'-phosphate oxidase family protein
LGRLATVTAMGDPHVVPIAFRYNAELDSIDLGGHHIATTAKWRHVGAHPRVSFVVDDVLPPWQPRFIMVTADAELLLSGGQDLGPGFAPELMRLWPVKTTSYGINES